MARDKTKSAAALIEQMLGEASWLLSHTQALTDYGRLDEAMVERGHAATCEEQVACLLEADGQEQEAAIHRVSAAACYEKLGQFSRAVTLLHAALSTPLSHDYRTRVEKQLALFGPGIRRTEPRSLTSGTRSVESNPLTSSKEFVGSRTIREISKATAGMSEGGEKYAG